MKPILILFAIAFAALAQPSPRPTISVGADAPAASACERQTVGNIYVRSENAANGPINVQRCTQTGALTYAWHPIGHLVVATLPDRCEVGSIAYKTGVTAGQNLYACTTTDNWTQQGGAVSSPSTNGLVFWDGAALATTATGGAGTKCAVSASGAAPIWGACSGTAATDWAALTDPTAGLSLAMAANATVFTYNATTGAIDGLKLADTASNTGTGNLFRVSTASGSAMHPVRFDVNGAGVQMSTAGLLAAIGSGGISATHLSGTSLAGLSTGILKITTTTGAPSIAVAGDFPTLNQNTTGTAVGIAGGSGGQVAFQTGAGATGFSAGLAYNDTTKVLGLIGGYTAGQSGVATGTYKINGTTSGTITITGASAAGTWQMTLPTTAGTSGQVLQTNGSGVTTWADAGSGSGTVTSVGFTGGLLSVATATTTPAFTVAGTSGGVPYFSSASTWASSGALTANLPVFGGGAGAAPIVGTRSGNTTAVVTTTGAQTSGRCVEIDASGNHIASAAGCAAGAGTVSVVASGALTSTAIVTGGGTTTLQTAAPTATMDSSGNISTPGTISSGVGAPTAGGIQMQQGTANTAAANTVLRQAPAAVTAYTVLEPGTAATGFYLGTNSSGTVTTTQVASTGSGSVVLATSPTLVTPILGTPTSGTLTNATGLPEGGLAMTNITTNNVSITKHGFAPILPNDATKYLDGTGVYSVPAGTGGGSTGIGRTSLTATYTAIPDGACQSQTATWTGATTSDTITLGAPAGLAAGLLPVAFVSAADTVAIRLCNLSGASVTPGSTTFAATLAVYNLSGSGTIDFASISDGACASNTFTLTGVAASDPIVSKWPSTLEAGLFGSMIASATDTVQVRLCNFSGSSVDPASQSFGAAAAK